MKIYEGQTPTHTEVLNGGTNWTYEIPNGSVTRINIVPDNNDTNIGRLTFTGDDTQNIDVILGTGTSLGLGDDPTSVGNNWAGLDTSGASATFRLYGGITGNLTDSILVEQLDRFVSPRTPTDLLCQSRPTAPNRRIARNRPVSR